jgi:hypothetical protein
VIHVSEVLIADVFLAVRRHGLARLADLRYESLERKRIRIDFRSRAALAALSDGPVTCMTELANVNFSAAFRIARWGAQLLRGLRERAAGEQAERGGGQSNGNAAHPGPRRAISSR